MNKEMTMYDKPEGATHHELGAEGYAYYDASSKPHRKWGGLAWIELGEFADVTTWATPIDQEAKIKSFNRGRHKLITHTLRKWST